MTAVSDTPFPLLVLGASGRVGCALQTLAHAGHWPGSVPLWHGRTTGGWVWDMHGAPPALPGTVSAIVCLAGVTTGDATALAGNTSAALAALRLGETLDAPVILASSAAVYAASDAPHSEDEALNPAQPYGAAKQAMEQAAKGSGATILRLANIAGCDALFRAMASGPVTLDRLGDGGSPARAYIGPLTLARVLEALARALRDDSALPVPGVLNVAQPGPVAMAAILEAAGAAWLWREAPATVLPLMALDTGRLERAMASRQELPAASAATLVAEARLAGWHPA